MMIRTPSLHSISKERYVNVRRTTLLFAATACSAFLALALLVAGVNVRPADATATTYTVTDLGTLTDVGTLAGNTIARGVNSSGKVVGHSLQRVEDGTLQLRAFHWDGGPMQDLGTLGGPSSAGRGINDSGQVVGFARTSPTDNQQRAFVTEKDAQGNMRLAPLGTLPGYSSSEAWAINESGQIVGRSSNTISSGRAFLYGKDQDGAVTMQNLGVLSPADTYSEAWALNSSGQVVGESGSDESHGQAFLYEGGAMKGLGTLPGLSYSEAFGIDDSGQIVGWSYSSRASVQGRAFIYRNRKMEDLGTLPGDLYSMARAIDKHGRVVGQSRTASGQNRAFLWENDVMTDLNSLIPTDSPLRLLDAYAISESGQIVGSAANSKNQVRAFLLTPNDATAPTTAATISPEPNAAGWNRGDVAVTLDATDVGGSNVEGITFSASGAQPIENRTVHKASTRISIAAEGETTITYSATDHAGNTEEPESLTVRLDKTAPSPNITTPAAGAEYKLGEMVTADYACSDGGSGIDSCTGSVPVGGNIDTTSIGPKTFAVEATDRAGNAASESHDYSVVYDFGGFYAPVDNPGMINRVQAGSAVPVKFGLSGDQGLDVFAEGYPDSRQVDCDSTAPVDTIEQTVAARESTLSYDATADQYTYVWKTQKSWAGTCRQFTMKLEDGTTHPAVFKFRG
jgi:probable HAF family extracellular repeat protein